MKIKASAILLVAAMVATTAFGQGPRRGPGFGFGGPGGGSLFRLAGNEAVQKELNLKLDQVDKIKALNEEVRKEYAADGERPNFQGLSPEERQKKMEELRAKGAETAKKVNEKFRPKLAEILDASQLERVQQISYQAAGTRALSDAEVVKALKISKEQSDKLAEINKEFEGKQRELFRGGRGNGNFEEARTKMRELSEARDKKALEVLSTDQQAQFTKLKGKEFDVSKLREGRQGGQGEGRRRRNRSN